MTVAAVARLTSVLVSQMLPASLRMNKRRVSATYAKLAQHRPTFELLD